MPAIVLILLRETSLDKIADAWNILRRTRCILRKKCDLNCDLCHKSLLLKHALYPDVQKIEKRTVFYLRTPLEIKISQLYTILRVLILFFKDAIEKILIPLSLKEQLIVKIDNGRILLGKNARNIITTKIDYRYFPPPYMLKIFLKKVNEKNVLELLDIDYSELEVIRQEKVKTLKIFTDDPRALNIKFKKFETGLIIGNPRIYSKHSGELIKYLLQQFV